MHPRTPNIGAVARAAGVSVGTVSNALNAPDRLAPETLDRVLGIIDELGYIRSSAGRTLIRNAADDFSLIVPDIDNSLFVDIARGAQLTAAESGQRLVMANSGFSSHDLVTGRSAHDAQDDFLGYFAEARSGGVLVCAMRDPTAGIARIRNHVRPIVVVNFDAEPHWVSFRSVFERIGICHRSTRKRSRIVPCAWCWTGSRPTRTV